MAATRQQPPATCGVFSAVGSCVLDPLTPKERRRILPGPGDCCHNVRNESHLLVHPQNDVALQQVLAALQQNGDLAPRFGAACSSAIDYVLDGPRTGRFDLTSAEVDSDERASVGTKLQYHLLDELGLEKYKKPDTYIAGTPVDIKGTVGSTQMIPREAQCELCILVKIDTRKMRHQSWLMRTHRAWLHGGVGNQDAKRGIRAKARSLYAVPLYDAAQLPINPLTRLSSQQLDVVFANSVGQQQRLLALFEFLPDTVIPRDVILTVCFNRDDPLRRVRAIKADATARGLQLLVGKWTADRTRAEKLGFDLSGRAWVAVRAQV